MWELCQTAGPIGNTFGIRMQIRLHMNGYIVGGLGVIILNCGKTATNQGTKYVIDRSTGLMNFTHGRNKMKSFQSDGRTSYFVRIAQSVQIFQFRSVNRPFVASESRPKRVTPL